MSTAVTEYLKALEAELGCFVRAGELTTEVSAHLHESVERLEHDGADTEDATAQAIARLGTPREIAAAFARQGEPLAVPTRFTRASGWLAVISLPFWAATFVLIQGAQEAEKTRDWEGLPQALFVSGMATMLVATLGFLVAALGLSRRVGALGRLGTLAIALLGLGVPLVAMAWLIPAWTAVLAVALVALGWQLRVRQSPFATHVLLAAAGPAGAFASFWVFAGIGNEDLWGVPFGIMLLSAGAFAALGYRLVREPSVAVPSLAAG
jgi:hypothetical protein